MADDDNFNEEDGHNLLAPPLPRLWSWFSSFVVRCSSSPFEVWAHEGYTLQIQTYYLTLLLPLLEKEEEEASFELARPSPVVLN